ncbi:MAG TPA: ATP-binding protein [Thermoanaerobaculia bacterium]|nr:ATP-binding protein [Thermoanaerobaculia bacterium]
MKPTRPRTADELRDLRARAEERLRSRDGAAPNRTEANALRLQHELQVHQIELELQNAELQRSRDELEASLERYTDLYDFAPVSYFTLGRSGDIFSANLTGADLLNVPRARLIGRRFETFLAPESRLAFASFLSTTIDGAHRESCELTLVPAGGKPRTVRLEGTASPAANECRAAVVDVTEQRAAEAAVRKLNFELETTVRERTAQLESANADLEAFGHGVSLALRASVLEVSDYARILSEEFAGGLPAAATDYLAKIQAGDRRMEALIDDLLRLSRIGRSELRRTTVDLAIPCREILARLAAASPDRRVETVVAGTILVLGDAPLLHVMLESLLGNAWRFTSEVPGSRIEVTDSGVGFDVKLVGKLFQPLRTLHASEKYQGTGIGLAIVDRIVRRHGGSVWTEDVEGLGTTVHVRLPAPVDDVQPG